MLNYYILAEKISNSDRCHFTLGLSRVSALGEEKFGVRIYESMLDVFKSTSLPNSCILILLLRNLGTRKLNYNSKPNTVVTIYTKSYKFGTKKHAAKPAQQSSLAALI